MMVGGGRFDLDESVAAADINITKVENPNQNKKPSTPSSAAPKKMETKNPFDVFGIFPEEAHKPDGMGPLESSITSRVPNGTTKRACTLNGDYFLELRVYNTADISGVLIQKRWKKAFVTLRAQIVDESDEWEALQTFIKKISALFKDADVKFYSNDTKSNGCTLPPYPAHGTYTVHDRPEAVPGQTYGLAIITITCDPGYEVLGNNATYCFSNNNWQPMPRCTREELIINGTKAAHGDLPWHAAIYDKSYTPFMQVCGGSLVSTKRRIASGLTANSQPPGTQWL
ncbi:hypothetical protein MSG28_014605 [Choristoneura fumiferana]|uniref:Uncharacterized protein n=1 Tax=Choristoneura fumiferana TaxID=7141 RepID=A0ACC0JRY2_CHOFU|nr:hypothetical protein MSG28_014605 [Choristoneura fumiferana]